MIRARSDALIYLGNMELERRAWRQRENMRKRILHEELTQGDQHRTVDDAMDAVREKVDGIEMSTLKEDILRKIMNGGN